MNFFKAIFSWKLWLNVIIGLAILAGLWHFTFNYLDEYTQHDLEIAVPDISEMNIEQAMTALKEADLDFEIDSVRFTEEHPPLAVIEYFPKAGSKVKPGRRIFIKSNPSTWMPIEMPHLVDKSKRLAFTQLKLRGFVVGDTIYEEDPAKDVVLRVMYNGKEAEAGQKFPRGTQVDLVLGRGYGVDVPVPDLEGMTLVNARKILEENFFDVGQIYHLGQQVTAENDSLIRVVYQDPPHTAVYDEGLPVSLWLSMESKGDLRKQIDSLDKVFRRNLDEDSIFINSVQKSKEISTRNLSDELKNQIGNDQMVDDKYKPDAGENQPSGQEGQAPVIDTTGIKID